MRVLLVIDVPGWAYHRRALGIKKYAPPDIQYEILSWQRHTDRVWKAAESGDFDVVFLLDSSHTQSLMRKKKPNTKLVASYNNSHYRSELYKTVNHAQVIVVNNRIALKNYFDDQPAAVYLPTAVDLSDFYVIRPWGDRPNRVLWVGRDTKRQIKRYDSVLWQLQSDLKDLGIESDWYLVKDIRHLRDTDQMREWYNSGRYCICVSSYEGTPNYLLEAAACGCIPISTMVGNMGDFLRDGQNGFLIDDSDASSPLGVLNAAVEGCRRAEQAGVRVAQAALQTIQNQWSWEKRALSFSKLMRSIVNGDPLPRSWPEDFVDVEHGYVEWAI